MSLPKDLKHSYYEASARGRILGLLDPGSFRELLPPQERAVSPHLQILGFPAAFDDGVIVGGGSLNGKPVLIAAQEGAFMGGSVGEVHGAKITGLLERALAERRGVLLLLESGGVRLHEANCALIAVSEIMRAVLELRAAGVPCIGLIGGTNGCFGGMSLVARLCDAIVMSEEGRLGLSGPEVIETVHGVEEFDSRDRALVWRTVGGKHRYLLREADRLVDDDIQAFRAAAIELLAQPKKLDLATLEQEQAKLNKRMTDFGACPDAVEVWSKMGIPEPKKLSLLDAAAFLSTVSAARGTP